MAAGRTAVSAALALFLSSVVLLSGSGPMSSTQAPEPATGALGDLSLAPSPAKLFSPTAPMNPELRPALGAIGELKVTTRDPAVVPNTGLRVNISAYPALPLPPGASFQVGAEEQVGAYEAVVGIFENNFTAPVPFFSVFQLSNDSTVHLAYWPAYPIYTGSPYEFVLTVRSGTVWQVRVNGELFAQNTSLASFDFGMSQSTDAANLSFAEAAIYSSSSPTPSRVDVPLAFGVQRSTGWYLPQNATTGFAGGANAQWGVEGRLQHPTLAPGEITTGTSVANLTNGTLLWTGGVVPISVSLHSPVATARGLTDVPISVATTALGGGAVPNVAVFFSDSGNGTMLPPSLVTSATGVGGPTLITPNVSRTVTDVVRATVTTFGYSGAATLPLVVEPAVQAIFSVDPPTPSVTPRGTLTLTYRAVDSNGTPLSGLEVVLSATLGGSVSNPQSVTDAQGSFAVNVYAPAVSFWVNASVTSPGYWGAAAVFLVVANATPTFLERYGTYVAVGAIVGTAALLATLVILGLRRRRKPLPSSPIRRYLLENKRAQEARGPPKAGSEPEPNATRTPPSGGTP